MFEPTIKYKRVNDPPQDITPSFNELTITDAEKKAKPKVITEPAKETSKSVKAEPVKETTKPKETPTVPDYTFEEEEEEDNTIEVDPTDKERIIVTLSTGRIFTADRYCPHAGADLSYHGKVSEHDYPPEIGPVLMCPIHYWEFALEKQGKGGGGWATINACEMTEKCPSSPNLDW